MHTGDFDACTYLWDELTKTPDEHHVTYTAEDIDMLWYMGFVDTARHPLAEWQTVFGPYRQPDDTFVLSKPDFMTLDQYRFKEELYAPFNALEINEGQYTDEGLHELIDASIVPECGLSASELHTEVEALKERMRLDNDLIRIETEAKAVMANWLAEHPSPLRRLEIFFYEMLEARSANVVMGLEPLANTPEGIAEAEASTFAMLSNSPEEQRAKALKTLEKAKLPHGMTTPAKDVKDPGVELHTIRRSRRGVKT